ncbi:MAG: exosome protein [archaeon]|nr:exosome protein [archaeon]
MQAVFHWLRTETFCYATEKEDLVGETFMELIGTDEFDSDISESEHGNQMTILQSMMTKQKDMVRLFTNLGPDMLQVIKDDIDNRVDEDCIFYIRLDKQKAVCGKYAMAHHGDVISITGKIASNPARKEIAMANLLKFIDSLLPSDPQQDR